MLFSGSYAFAQVDERVYEMAHVEQAPEFPGGRSALADYFSKIKTYQEAVDNGLTGKIVATFVITETGEVADVRLTRSHGAKMEQEFIKMIKNMPVWKPGEYAGRRVKVSYRLPLQVCFFR